jgi:hypothetical protein
MPVHLPCKNLNIITIVIAPHIHAYISETVYFCLTSHIAVVISIPDRIFASSEFFALHGNSMPAFVGSLYGDLLGRTASTAEINGWANSGLSRNAISNFFLQSNERLVRDSNSIYRTYLGRPIDAPSLVNVEAFINTGGRIQDLLDGIFTSTEYWDLHR